MLSYADLAFFMTIINLNIEYRMPKRRIALAAPAPGPRIALSLYLLNNDHATRRLSTGRIPYFDIRHSILDIRYSNYPAFFARGFQFA